MTCGIYSIMNRVNNKRYIGSSTNIENRWKRHVKLLDDGKHHSRHLQRAWMKYGKENFVFKIIIRCLVDELLDYEQAYLDRYIPEYNVSPAAGRTAGVIRSQEYINKQRLSQKGKILSVETKKKISEGMKGKRNSLGVKRIHSQTTKDKIRNTLLGHVVSIATRLKIGNNNKGYKHTEEAKRKIGIASLGNKYATRNR